MITRELPRNRYVEATGNPLLRTTAGDAFTAARTADYMTDLAARQTEIAKAERRGQPARSLPMQMYDREGNRIEADDLSRIAGGPDQDIPGPRPEVERIAPETLNERYADLGLEFDAPMTEEGASILADAKRAEMVRNDIIARGPEGVTGAATVLAGGLAGMATDPLEVLTAIIPVVGAGRAASIIGRLGTIRGRAVIGATEGLVGAAATEPVVALMSRQQQLDYTFNDALLNTVLGGMLGAGIGTTAGVLRKFRGERIARTTEEVGQAAAPEIEDAISARARVDADVTARTAARTPDATVAPTRATETAEPVAATPAVRTAETAATRAAPASPDLPTRADEAEAARVALSQVATGRAVDLEPVMARQDAPQDGNFRMGQEVPPPAPGTVRMFHGGHDADTGGPRWFTSSQSNAAGWAAQRGGVPGRADEVWYVDVPRDDPMFRADYEEQSVDRGFTVQKEFDPSQYGAPKLFGEIPPKRTPEQQSQELARRAQDPANDYSADVEASREISDRLASTGDDWLSEDEAMLMAELETLRARGELNDAAEAAIEGANRMADDATAAGDVARAYAACMGTR